MPTCIQLRRSPASAWQAANPVLANGEIGLETDTGRLKIGDAVKRWSDLDYALDKAFTTDEKAKLATIQAGATAAGASGDAHAARTGNPHGTTAAQVGAEPAGGAQAAVAAHQAATTAVHTTDQISDTATKVLMTATERSKLAALPQAAAPAAHVGAGGTGAHPLAVASTSGAGGTAGFLSGPDKEKLNGITAGAQPNPAQVSSAERTAGAEAGLRSYSPADIKTMVQTHGLTTVPNADGLADGTTKVIMTALERGKLAGLPAAAAPAAHVGAGGTGAHPLAIASASGAGGTAGFLSPPDKEKLNGVTAGAQPNPVQVSSAERTAGTEAGLRSYSPADIKTMVQTHGQVTVPNADGLADGTTKVIMTAAERTKLADLDSATRSHIGAGGVVQHSLVVPSVGGVGGAAGFMDPKDKEALDKFGPGSYGAGARNVGDGTGVFSRKWTELDNDRGILEFRSLQGRQSIAASLSADGNTVYLDYTGPASSTPALIAAIDAALGSTAWRTGGGSGLPAAAQTITTSYVPVVSPTVFLGGTGGFLRLPPVQSGVHAVDIINDGTGPWSVHTGGLVEGMTVTANTALPNTDLDKNPFVLSFDPHGLPTSPQLTLAWVMYPTATTTNWQLLGTSSTAGNTGGGANLIDIGTCIIGGVPNAGIIVRVMDASGGAQVDARWPYPRNQLSVCYLTMDLAAPAAELWINGALVPMSAESVQWPPKTPRSTPTPAPNEPSFAFAAAGRNRMWIGGGQSGSRFELDGALGRLWVTPGQYLPGAANAAKFCVPNSATPVFLGLNGQLPTGIAPAYFLNGDNREFARNFGSVGNIGTFSTDVAARISSAATSFAFIEKMSWGTAPMVVAAGGSIALRRKATVPLTTWVEAR